MILNSDFSDYYDFCTKYGVDKAIVYNRKTRVVSRDHSKEIDEIMSTVKKLNGVIRFKDLSVLSGEEIVFLSIGGHPYFFDIEDNCTVATEEICEYVHKKRLKDKHTPKFWNSTQHNLDVIKHENLLKIHKIIDSPLFMVSRWKFIVDPCLREHGLHLDPHVVYTQIFNSLCTPEPKVPQPSDKILLKSHDMDHNSFKQSPGGPTRKRKKL